ncbi:uncharacterized protein JCM6883_006278 [Sporobolomyces salmoneus]|uniref:uncharacterized protein n=1 Tax=Sporobolomyces salmoneus TaxID=183962 RepID=UPI00316C6CA6
MSIFASTSAPNFIQIPSFSSPERPTQSTAEVEDDHSTLTRQQPLLTRAEERQMRFKNANTKWDSLSRMIEEQKATGSSSLLQLFGGGLDYSAALGGKGKASDIGTKQTRRKSTRGLSGIEGKEKTMAKNRKSASPVKEQGVQKPKTSNHHDAGARKRSVLTEEVAEGKEEKHSSLSIIKAKRIRTGTRKDRMKPDSLELQPTILESSFPPSAQPTTAPVPDKPKGRVPRAAISRQVKGSRLSNSPQPSRPPPSPRQSLSSVAALQPGAGDNEQAPASSNEGVQLGRKKPRATPPTPSISQPKATIPARDSDSQTVTSLHQTVEKKRKLLRKEESPKAKVIKKRRVPARIESKDHEQL